jgi:serine/threonine protein kinase
VRRCCTLYSVLQAGQVVAGRYLLESVIGEGAMGTVFRAEDQTLRRQVAIKFLFVKGMRDPQLMVDQFLREARIAASVQHRNVIQTVDFGTVDQQPFMVMELLSGESLGERMEREPPLTSEQLIHIVSLTLRGLAAVHDAGIVHRDLKPQNIFLQRDGEAVYPKILDFGISRSLQHGGDRPSAIATQEGLIIGTPDYMSPEQARGEANIDQRSDIYSMSVILYEGLTGRPPFAAETVGDLIVQIMTKEPKTMRELSPAIAQPLSDMVAQAMSKNREQRFSDARAMRRALLGAAESALPVGRRAMASLRPVEPVPSAASPGLAAPASGFSLELDAAAARRAASAEAGGATWGDFEGLSSPRTVDDSPPPLERPPSLSAPGPQQQRVVGRFGDELELAPIAPKDPVQTRAPTERASTGRGAAERAPAERASLERSSSAGRNRKSAKQASQSRNNGLDQALDPLYAGAEQAAPDIDYDRAGPSARKLQQQAQPALTSRARRRPRPESPRPRTAYKRSFFPWLLPVAALLLLGYITWKPSLGSLSESGSDAGSSLAKGAADSGVTRLHMLVKARRESPAKAPPHMRDVVF